MWTRGVGAAGGALVAAGSLLDWSGVSYSSHLDRGLTLAAGLLLLAAAIWGGRLLVVAIPLGALALDMGVVNYRDVANHRYEYEAYPEAAVGLGLYLVVAGASLALAAGALALGAWLRRRAFR